MRHGLLQAVCEAPTAGLDLAEHPAWIRHADGTLEETLRLATPPLETDQPGGRTSDQPAARDPGGTPLRRVALPGAAASAPPLAAA